MTVNRVTFRRQIRSAALRAAWLEKRQAAENKYFCINSSIVIMHSTLFKSYLIAKYMKA
jgi:hypothetical protein